MKENFYYQLQDQPTHRSSLLRFAATDLDLYKNDSLWWD